MAIADYLRKLIEMKNQLVANLKSMGVTADESEKLNTLVPKVLKCKTDVIWLQDTVSTEVTSVNIPNGVTSIGDSAFWNYTSLSSITIPDSVTSIGDSAFRVCISLTSITIPDNVMYIGANAFYNCRNLESVTIGNGVINIGKYAFINCIHLTGIYVSENNNNYCDINGVLFNKNKSELLAYPMGKIDNEYSIPNGVTSIGSYIFSGCTSLTSITIPDSVTTIGDCAFQSCSGLSSVTIGNGVTSIGDIAFAYCTSLANIYYKGTEEQWNAITKSHNWNSDMGSNVSGGTKITYNYTS